MHVTERPALDVSLSIVAASQALNLRKCASRYLHGESQQLGSILAQLRFPFALAQAHLVNHAETGGALLIACLAAALDPISIGQQPDHSAGDFPSTSAT
jgi:hypothetical protein